MKIRVLAGIAAAAIILSAIAIAGTAAKTSDQNKIRVAFFPNISHAVPIIGTENGEFAKKLGEIPIQTVIVDSGPQAIEALFANSVDIAYVGPSPIINGYVKSGQGIKIISGAANNGASLIVQKDSEISQISDLAGKKVSAPSIGNTQDVSLRYYLSENDLRPAERGGSVIVYNTANSETFTLFAKGDIDAAWVPEPTATILVEQLGGLRLLNEEALWPNKEFPSVLLIGRTDFIEKHPDWIKNWLEAHQNTINWINQNPEKTEAVFVDFYKKHTGKTLPQNIVHGSFSHITFTSNSDPEAIKIFAERAYDLGYLGRSGYNIEGIFYDTEDVSWQN